MQQREDHWAIVDLKGKAGHTRTVPMPDWVKALLDNWLQAANINGESCLAGKQERESLGRWTDG